VTDEPEPVVVPLTAAISASTALSATPTVTPFRVRLIEACEAALARLETKAGPEHNIFAETGEVLFWLYAISNDGVEHPTIAPGLRWARDNYGHGILVWELHYTDHGAMLGHLRLDVTPLGAEPVHRWVGVNASPGERHRLRLAMYNRFLAGQPVIATLRVELGRLVSGAPLPDEYHAFDGLADMDFADDGTRNVLEGLGGDAPEFASGSAPTPP
jgi:hypothetical protein